MKLNKILFIPDCHIPYEDKRAFNLLLSAAKVFKPDTVIILGDFVDFYTVSSHSKDPKRDLKLTHEVEKAIERLKQLKDLGASKYVYVSGNHEDRLVRYLQDKAPELRELLEIDTLLQLKPLNYEYISYKEYFKIGKLYVTHDTGVAGATAHSKALSDFQDNVIIGHTHRIAYSVVGTAKGVPHVGAMFGWLGDVKKVDYMHQVKANRDWAHGFGIGYLQPNGNVHITPITMVDYKVVVEGKLVEG